MYYDYDEFENYYEPTPADEIFNEAMEKFKETLKDSVKNNLNYMQEENKRLNEENKALRNKSYEVESKDRQLEQKEKDLERTFYKSKFSELLKPLEENMKVWYADYSYKKVKKCNLCDKDRKITFTSPQGNTIKQKCECDKNYKSYFPKETTVSIIELGKHYDYNNSTFYAKPKYQNNSDDDSRWCKFEIDEIMKTFELNKAEYYDTYNTSFKSKKECQQYCDWLNKREKEENNIIPIPKEL